MPTEQAYRDMFLTPGKNEVIGVSKPLSIAPLVHELSNDEIGLTTGRTHLCLLNIAGDTVVAVDVMGDPPIESRTFPREIVLVLTRGGVIIKGPLWGHQGLAVRKPWKGSP